MIIYRKEKNYKKELSVINSGIKAFEKFYKTSSGRPSKKLRDISERLNKAFHLIDKKGMPIYNPEPIDRWQKERKWSKRKLRKLKRIPNKQVGFFLERISCFLMFFLLVTFF